jgi:hypothetical protein
MAERIAANCYVYISPQDLEITNPCLDESWVNELTRLLANGKINPDVMGVLFVGLVPGQGYFTNDGNHRLAAYKAAGVEKVLVEVYLSSDL